MRKSKPRPTAEAGFDLLTPVKHYYCIEFETEGKQLLAYNDETDPKAFRATDRLTIKKQDPVLQALYESVRSAQVYTSATQLIMFKKYNYVKYLAEKARQGLTQCELSEIRKSDIRTWLACNKLAIEIRNKLISNNIKLLLFTITSILERKNLNVDYEHVLSECTNKMFAIVDGFNYTLNFQFSTYLYRSISNYIGQIMRRKRREEDRYVNAGEIDYSVFNSTDDAKLLELSDIEYVMGAISTLDERSQDVLNKRFGIGTEPETLLKLAQEYGVTKERIRQIELLALKRIRLIMSLNSKRYQQELSHMMTY